MSELVVGSFFFWPEAVGWNVFCFSLLYTVRGGRHEHEQQ